MPGSRGVRATFTRSVPDFETLGVSLDLNGLFNARRSLRPILGLPERAWERQAWKGGSKPMRERTENRLIMMAVWLLFAFTLFLGYDLFQRGLL
jgi:hypothetical protein